MLRNCTDCGRGLIRKKMKTLDIDLTTPDGRAAWEGQQKRQKRGRATRPDIPAAGRRELGAAEREKKQPTLWDLVEEAA